MKTRANSQTWSIQSYPGKVRLPSDILRPLPSAEAANEVSDPDHITTQMLSFCPDPEDGILT